MSGARRAAQPARSPRMLALGEAALEAVEPLPELVVLPLELLEIAGVAVVERLQRRVALPPVDAHLPRPVHRGHEQPQLDREQLDVEQVDLDVAGDDDALV